jgi:hypothetical protein
MKPSLLILAAGMGSRYGGLKQLDGFGPKGETLMEYSVTDAMRSGFAQAVFVIRRDFAEAFEQGVLAKLRAKGLPCSTAFQDMEPGRAKPWGTGHAVLSAREAVQGPFVMVNADDFYGLESFAAMAKYFEAGSQPGHCAMIGYRLKDTLSEHGQVTRAICRLDAQGRLIGMEEVSGIGKDAQGNLGAGGTALTGEELVSMNCFGFGQDFFGYLEKKFTAFKAAHANDPKAEFMIPEVVNQAVQEGWGEVAVLEGSRHWFGVTYAQDKERVRKEIAQLHEGKVYA